MDIIIRVFALRVKLCHLRYEKVVTIAENVYNLEISEQHFVLVEVEFLLNDVLSWDERLCHDG